VALRKAEILLRAKAHVIVVSPHFVDEFAEHATTQSLLLYQRPFVEDDLEKKALVVAATDDHALNAAIAAMARKKNILVNAVDQAEASTFIFQPWSSVDL